MRGPEFGSEPEEMNEDKSWTGKINKRKRPLVAALGVLGLLSWGAIGREHTPGAESAEAPQEQALSPVGTTFDVTPDSSALSDAAEAQLSHEQLLHIAQIDRAYAELGTELERITKGLDMQNKYSGHLITLESAKDEIGNDFKSMIETAVVESDNYHDEDRLKFLESSVSTLLEHYIKSAEGMDDNEKVLFKQEAALSMAALMNEYLARRSAGNLEHSVLSGHEAQMVENVDKVIEAMGLSQSTARVSENSIRLNINGKAENLEEAKLIENFYGKAIEVPLELASGVELTNLYDIRETDPDQFTKIVDQVLATNGSILTHQAGERLGREVLQAELRQMLVEGDRAEVEKTIAWPERLSFDIDIEKLWNLIPMPVLELGWSGDKSKIEMSYQLEAEGGKISPTMLCQGNHIEIISLSSEGRLLSPGKETFPLPLLFLLLPLAALLARRKKKEMEEETSPVDPMDPVPEGPGPDTSDPTRFWGNDESDNRPPVGGTEVKPGEDGTISYIRPEFPEIVQTDLTPDPLQLRRDSLTVTFPERSQIDNTRNPEPTPEKDTEPVNYEWDKNGQMFFYTPISKTNPGPEAGGREPEETFYVYAKLKLNPENGEVTIVETGETDAPKKISDRFRVEKAAKASGGDLKKVS